MNRNRKLFGVFLLLALFTASAVAQVATADLHVAVKDSKSAIVKNATVTVKNLAQGTERSQTSNVDGEYSFRALPPGVYEVTITAEGFAKTVAKDVKVTVGQVAELPITMGVASVSEVVNVSAEAEMVETQRSSASTTIEETRIDNLPINGRNYINFALTDSKLARDTAPSIGAAPTSGINSGGQRARGNQVNVDGMDAVDNSTNGIRSTVSQEAVQEFQLLTNGYDAEYGRASGAVVNIISKGGTNQLHGSAYGYLRNRLIQATNPFSVQVNPTTGQTSPLTQPGYTRTQAGFTIGGPIKKDKTFFFLAFETTRRNESGYSSIGENNFGLTSTMDLAPWMTAATGIPAPQTIVPVTAQQAQFLGAFWQPGPCGGPLLTCLPPAQQQQLVGYAILAGTSGPVALSANNPFTAFLHATGAPQFAALNQYFFAPTVSGQFDLLPTNLQTGVMNYVPLRNLIGNYPIHEITDIYSLRLDHRLTNNQNLMLRAGVSPSDVSGIQVQGQGAQSLGQNAYSRTSQNNFHDWSIAAQHNWTIGSSKVNELRFQYSRRSLNYSYANTADGAKVGVNMPGYALFGREPFSFVRRKEQRYQFTDHFSLTKGKHSFKWGGDLNYLPLVADFTVNFGGVYNFGAIDLGNGLPALSAVQTYGAGLPQNFIQGVGNPHDSFSNTAIAGFFQDSWRATRSLTLNLGVRYDVELTPTFAPTTALADNAQKAIGLTQGIPRDYNNFAPRVGLAWDVFGTGKTVFRASYGLFYDHPLLGLAFDSDVADGSQAPQLVLFGGQLVPCSSSSALNAANTFTGRFGACPQAAPSQLNFIGYQQRFDPTPNAPTLWANQGFLNAGVSVPFLPWTLPTGSNFVYPYSNQVNVAIEHEFSNDMSLGIQYNFSGGRHLNRPINKNAVRTDLLVQNWQIAMNDPNVSAAAKAGYANDPRFVSPPANAGLGLPAGVLGMYTAGGQTYTYVNPALVSFFRPSGLNISYFQPGMPLAPLAPMFQQYLSAIGLPSIGAIPFSDTVANVSSGSSVYHGMSVNFRKRMSHKYEFLASYTWSHAIDDSTDLESPLAPQNNYKPYLDRSNSLFDQRHRFVLSMVYQSEKIGNGFKGALLNYWTAAPIIEVSSGRPFNIITGTDNNFDFGTTTDRPAIYHQGDTNSCGYTPVASKYSPTGYFINPCFKDGVFTGDLGRNAGTMPMTVFTDMRLSRRINVNERFKLDAMMDVFNIVNKFNVADVNKSWTQAGVPTASFDPRQFQFALKLSW